MDSSSQPAKRILVTGGLGFLGSHTSLKLLEQGFQVVIFDNTSNATETVLDRISHLLTEQAVTSKLEFVQGDIRNAEELELVFAKTRFDCVIHFAGVKSVGQSMHDPLTYYDNNVGGTIQLLKAMQRHGVRSMLFSSSSSVYGNPTSIPVDENHFLHPISPYARTKATIESILTDVAASDPLWRIAMLRYFNPAGAHPSGRLGEQPVAVHSLLARIQAAVRHDAELEIFGNDYATRDGTCVRDFIHVMDLVDAHLAALHAVESTPSFGCQALNVASETTTTVLEMVRTFEDVSGGSVRHKFVGRRKGDIAVMQGSAQKAANVLKWKSKRSVRDACRDAWASVKNA